MGFEAIFVGVLLLLCFVLFATEWLPVDLVALAALIFLALTKILSPSEALAGFANPALVTVAALFVVSAALLRTGLVTRAGRWMARISGKREIVALALLLLVVAAASAFINNTAVVIVFLPLALGLASELQISPSKILIPLAFASTMGGMLTLVGTSTSVLVAAKWTAESGATLRMFEFAPLGGVILAAGLVYLLVVGRRLLPSRDSVTTRQAESEYLTEITVPAGSRWIGKTLDQLGLSGDVKILQWIRGEQIAWPPFADRDLLQPGDSLLVRANAPQIMRLIEKRGLELIPGLHGGAGRIVSAGMRLAEIVITPQSSFIGKTVEESAFRRHHDVSVLAVQRRGTHVRERLPQMALRVGDTLLVHGSEDAVSALRGEEDFLLVEGVHEIVPNRRKAPIALAVTAGLIALAAMDIFSIEFLALAAAVTMVLSGCLSLREAYRSVDWSVLLLVVGTIALGEAMKKTGLAAWIAGGLIDTLQPWGPIAVLSGIYLLTMLVTELLSNNAAALLMLPIGLAAAAGLHADPRPFVIAIAFAASLAFAVPMGYQTYMMIYGPGSYRFKDFLRVGAPLDVIGWGLATWLIPIFWPL